ncbi:hypothetical protein [Streptomyces sp. NPDC052042]|uniref:hypothetical protein n=1 Tax=Streptomyces sp. NPDC052042 TaxID=3365683 RepID=UPI0037D404B0
MRSGRAGAPTEVVGAPSGGCRDGHTRTELRRAGEDGLTLCAEGARGRTTRDLLDDDASPVRAFDADSGEYVMAPHHAYTGWGPW